MINKLTVKAEKNWSTLSFDADTNVLNVSELQTCSCSCLLLFRVQALLLQFQTQLEDSRAAAWRLIRIHRLCMQSLKCVMRYVMQTAKTNKLKSSWPQPPFESIFLIDWNSRLVAAAPLRVVLGELFNRGIANRAALYWYHQRNSVWQQQNQTTWVVLKTSPKCPQRFLALLVAQPFFIMQLLSERKGCNIDVYGWRWTWYLLYNNAKGMRGTNSPYFSLLDCLPLSMLAICDKKRHYVISQNNLGSTDIMDQSDQSSDSVWHAKSGGQYKQSKQATTINIDVAASECIYRNTSSSPPRCKHCPAALTHRPVYSVCGAQPSVTTVPEASETGWTCELLGG